MNNKIPKELAEKQDQIRNETANKVLHAIEELTEQGYMLKIKDLVEYTGLSRSTFGKAHIREILIAKGIVKIAESVVSDNPKSLLQTDKLKKIIADKDIQLQRLREENNELEKECELLRGRLFLLMQQQAR